MGDIGDLLDAAAKMKTFFVGFDGLDGALRIHPGAVTRVDVEDLGRERIDLLAVAGCAGLLAASFGLFGRQVIEEAFAIFDDVSIEVDQCAEAMGDLVGDAADDPTGVGVAAEDYVCKLLPADEVDDVGDMGGEIDCR